MKKNRGIDDLIANNTKRWLLMNKIATEHGILLQHTKKSNVAWQFKNKIYIGEFEKNEYELLAFFHEMGHVIDKSIKTLQVYEEEKAAWDIGYKLANKYGISFSNEAIIWGKKQLKTYESKNK